MDRFSRYILHISLMAGFLIGSTTAHQPARAQASQYLHTDGNRIVDANGNQVILTGINWFGMETANYAPHGLWARSLESILDQVVELGFNTLRLPYSNQLFDAASVPNGINYDLNPDLEGLTGLEIMDRVIAEAGQRGLKVILDRHRPGSDAQSVLWYTPQYSEERWIDDWVMLAERYSGDSTVIGMDLHNEPHGPATWGSGDLTTDWRLAAERAGNAILAVNPDLLIIVEGVEFYEGDGYWWGGNLAGAREHPVRLQVPNRLVYSAHEYGPGVFPHTWFSDPAYPENMPEIWDRHWGYLQKEGIAPLLLGEFGGRSVGEDTEGIWQKALISYLRENNISYTYWTLNPNSGDTGGILLDDWQSVDVEKQELLSGYQFPLIGIEQREGRAAPSARSATPRAGTAPALTPAGTAQHTPTPTAAARTPAPAGSLKVRYRSANLEEVSHDAKPEFVVVNTGSTPVNLEEVELFYWFKEEPGQSFTFHCDWAQIGCEKVLGDFEGSGDLHHLRIHFSKGLEPLLPGEDTGEIKIRLNASDWSDFRQTDDYSFSPTAEFVDWERVTLRLGGNLVWGTEPGGAPLNPSPGTATPAISGTKPALPRTGAGQEGETDAPRGVNIPASPEPVQSSGTGWETWVIALLASFTAGFIAAVVWWVRRDIEPGTQLANGWKKNFSPIIRSAKILRERLLQRFDRRKNE